jgi:16S rRNA C967 or C1407 C5-methylase (RsmB/RsmF family)
MMMGALSLSTRPNSILDMCAAPGGKSAIAWRGLKPQLLVCNEVVGKRHRGLTSNLSRCKIPAVVTQQDPSNWAESGLKFDLVIVDAPCSGQSLYARGEAETGCFHPSTVNGCRLRQRRILAESAKCVAPGGFLVYSTCTYSPEENEEIIDWFLKKNDAFKTRTISSLSSFKSTLTEVDAYRFFPSQDLGSGGFTALMQNLNPEEPNSLPEVPDDWIKWRPL